MSYAIDIQDVRAAAERIRGHAYRTPVMTCSMLDARAGRKLYFKCEMFQRAGAFKFRGAYNAVSKLPDEVASRGVVTHSSGNHAQALALVAKLRGIPAHIVMPNTAPAVKRRAVEGYGAQVYLCEPTMAARERTAAGVISETGAHFIHSFNSPDTMAGQGTAVLELLEEVGPLDAVMTPVGGGGLVSGTTIAAKAVSPRIRVIAAEPAAADDAARSKAAGRRILHETAPQTIADGLLTSLGDHTWPIVRDLVDDIVTVDDTHIIDAMFAVWERAKLIIEPSSAVPVAAVMSDAFRALPDSDRLSRVGIILTGGNVDLERLPWIGRAHARQ